MDQVLQMRLAKASRLGDWAMRLWIYSKTTTRKDARRMKQIEPLFDNHPSVVEQRKLKEKLMDDMQREQNRSKAECLLNAAADHIAATLEQPSDPRAWRQLLVYCPKDVLADFYQARMMRRIDEIRRGEDREPRTAAGSLD